MKKKFGHCYLTDVKASEVKLLRLDLSHQFDLKQLEFYHQEVKRIWQEKDHSAMTTLLHHLWTIGNNEALLVYEANKYKMFYSIRVELGYSDEENAQDFKEDGIQDTNFETLQDFINSKRQ